MRIILHHHLARVVGLALRFVLFLLFTRFFLFDPGVTNGESMEPSFRDNGWFLVNKVVYLFRSPRRFETVQFVSSRDGETLLVKRVIGLPGETIVIRRNAVYLRSTTGVERALPERYLGSGTLTRVHPGKPTVITVPPASYFVLGDNRLYSNDSREFGSVHRRLILGKVLPLFR